MMEMEDSILKNVKYLKYDRGSLIEGYTSLPKETSLTLYVNGEELVTIQCTPIKLNCLVVGFLYLENIIKSVDDILVMRICEDEGVADVRIKNSDFKPPTRRTLSSGCGGGFVFETSIKKVKSMTSISHEQILPLMRDFNQRLEIFKLTGGVHASILAENSKILVVSEDVGRHNTIDKIMGECLFTGINPEGKILLTTGRISSEMVIKASKMGVPIIISRHSATSRALSLAQDAGITLICHAKAKKHVVFTFPERLSSA